MTPAEAPAQLLTAFERQRAAHHSAPFPEWDVRRDCLERMLALIRDNEQTIEAAIADGALPADRTTPARVDEALLAGARSA